MLTSFEAMERSSCLRKQAFLCFHLYLCLWGAAPAYSMGHREPRSHIPPMQNQAVISGQSYSVALGEGVVIEMVWIPFLNGWAGRYEVTNEQYRRFKPRYNSGTYRGYTLDDDQQPVARVPMEDGADGALPFLNWLNARERLAGHIPPGYIYRLPMNAEWLQLARGPENRVYPWGASWPPSSGNYADRSAQDLFGEGRIISTYEDHFPVSCPVQQSGEQAYGLYGLGGNVWEWTTMSGDETKGEALGGSWLDRNEVFLRIGGKYQIPRMYGFEALGFRIFLMPTTP